MPAAVVDQIEEQIQSLALTKRIRPSEFFLDYDRLRSGYVTDTQFFRVLWENMGIKLTDDEQRGLADKYDLRRDGRVNYRIFCDVINKPFNPNNLKLDPAQLEVNPPELLGTSRTLRPLSPKSEGKLEQILLNMARYYRYRGINLRTSCEDFDRHHIGVIQESQFYRSFPRPLEINEQDVDLMVCKYRDPDRPGLLNYLNLHHDIEALSQRIVQEPALAPTVDVGLYLTPQLGADPDLQQVFDRIRVAVHKNRVRTIEFFKDYDKLRSGVITENQFICGLSLAAGKEAQLTRNDIQKIVEYYRVPDGRVQYKGFCDMMENAFNVPDLEKRPTQEVIQPPQGALGRNLPMLSDGEETRLRQVLSEMADQVRKRRLMMYQYFKDYDRSKGYSRVITQTQFGRILHFLTLEVPAEDFKLLCRKFADSQTGDINYPAFVQAVDHEFVNYTQSREETESPPSVKYSEPRPIDVDSVNMDELLARIRHYALVKRLRVCEYFQDFDPLRSGHITKSRFRRGLSDLGLSALGQHNLSDAQFEALSRHYKNPSKTDTIHWTRFTSDIESVFTQAGLEKMPEFAVPPPEIWGVPKPGTMDWRNASDEHADLVYSIMDRLRQRANQRRVLAKPIFQDFDRHNNGHVTRHQFRQCLTMLELNCTDAEMAALEAKFCNDVGFNYLAFLEELEPKEPPKHMYIERLKELRLTNKKAPLTKSDASSDLEEIIIKIKTKVYKERVGVHDWLRDYDKLRSGRMQRDNFRRALDLCKFELVESELSILEDHFSIPGEAGYVDYVSFCDEVESIFTTKHLDKAPQLDVQQFRPLGEWQQNILPDDMENLALQCMERLAEKVRKNRMQLFPLFEDYDRVHNGAVSRSQFRRVLNELELACFVSTEQEWMCLWKKFEVKVGGKDDVNYIGFCDMIYELAHFEWRKP